MKIKIVPELTLAWSCPACSRQSGGQVRIRLFTFNVAPKAGSCWVGPVCEFCLCDRVELQAEIP